MPFQKILPHEVRVFQPGQSRTARQFWHSRKNQSRAFFLYHAQDPEAGAKAVGDLFVAVPSGCVIDGDARRKLSEMGSVVRFVPTEVIVKVVDNQIEAVIGLIFDNLLGLSDSTPVKAAA